MNEQYQFKKQAYDRYDTKVITAVCSGYQTHNKHRLSIGQMLEICEKARTPGSMEHKIMQQIKREVHRGR